MPANQILPGKSEPGPQSKLVVAVLAGGQGRRMGRDKAMVEVDGVTLLERVALAAVETGFPVLVVGRRLQDISNRLYDRISAVPDDAPGQGPLQGLSTALRTSNADVLIVGVDVPLISARHFHWLASQAYAGDTCDGIIPVWQDQPQPLFGVYRRQAAQLVQELLSRGERSMKSLLAAGNFRYVPLPAEHRGAIEDVDTPDELHNLRSRLESQQERS